MVFEGLKEEALAEFVLETAIASPGCEQFCQHQHQHGIEMRSWVWARAAEKYYWAIGEAPKRAIRSEAENNILPFNLARSQEAQARIRSTIQRLHAQDDLPSTATARAKAIAVSGGLSLKTLYRYPELWHPGQERKIDLVVGDAGDRSESAGEALKPPEPTDNREFYTEVERMKCGDGHPEASWETSGECSLNSSESNSKATPRRDPSTESVTIESIENRLNSC